MRTLKQFSRIVVDVDAQLLAIAESVFCGMTLKYGGGVHQWNVQSKTFFKMLYVRVLLENSRSRSTLIKDLVGLRRFYCLRANYFHHQTLHFSSISSNIRAKSTREYEYIYRSSDCHHHYLLISSDRYLFQHIYLSPKRKSL